MRIVNKHLKWLAHVDGLKPAGHAAHRCDAPGHGRVVETQHLTHGHHAQHVLNVEAPPERALDVKRPPGSPHRGRKPLRGHLEHLGGDIGGRGIDTETH